MTFQFQPFSKAQQDLQDVAPPPPATALSHTGLPRIHCSASESCLSLPPVLALIFSSSGNILFPQIFTLLTPYQSDLSTNFTPYRTFRDRPVSKQLSPCSPSLSSRESWYIFFRWLASWSYPIYSFVYPLSSLITKQKHAVLINSHLATYQVRYKFPSEKHNILRKQKCHCRSSSPHTESSQIPSSALWPMKHGLSTEWCYRWTSAHKSLAIPNYYVHVLF